MGTGSSPVPPTTIFPIYINNLTPFTGPSGAKSGVIFGYFFGRRGTGCSNVTTRNLFI